MQKLDELYAMLPFDGSDVREHDMRYGQWLARQPVDVMQARRAEAEMIFRRVGITFAVYGAKDEGGAGSERLIPFDLIPRIIPGHEWAQMQRGLGQRVPARSRFIRALTSLSVSIRSPARKIQRRFSAAASPPPRLSPPAGARSAIASISIVRVPFNRLPARSSSSTVNRRRHAGSTVLRKLGISTSDSMR